MRDFHVPRSIYIMFLNSTIMPNMLDITSKQVLMVANSNLPQQQV